MLYHMRQISARIVSEQWVSWEHTRDSTNNICVVVSCHRCFVSAFPLLIYGR